MSIGYNTERTLKDFLVAVGDGERQLESARQRLCQIRDFAPNSAFQRMDRNCSGNVSSREFGDFLRDQGVYHISDSELYQLVSFFDNNGNGSLSFQEFLQMWLPCEDNILRNMTLDRYSARVGRFDRLPADIERAVTAVIELEITLQRRLEGLKGDLERNYDYNPYAAFAALDRNRNGSINSFEVGSFLRQNGHYASEMELVAIIRRIDTDGDATVNTSEFAAFMRRGAGGSIAPSSPPRARASSANRTSGYTSPLKNTSPARRGGSPVRGSPGPRLLPRAEDELISALKDLCNNEQDLENAKVSLSRERDFNLRDAFDIFDNNRSGRISASELYSGLNSIGVYASYEEVNLFITRYDGSGDMRLEAREFEAAFLAQSDNYAKNEVARRPSNYTPRPLRRDDCFLPRTADAFKSMWRTHIRVENAAEATRLRLAATPGFNAYEAFNSLDLNGGGSISASEIQRNLQSRGYFVGFQEASQVLAKFDANGNGSIGYSEFASETQPKSPSRRR
jgi:Ca2+-binding EF-hand superfamily protein